MQQTQLQHLKNNIPDNEIIIIEDFAKAAEGSDQCTLACRTSKNFHKSGLL